MTELSASTTFATKANLSGATFTGGINRDPQFYMDLASSNPRLNFDVDSHFDYNRSSNTLNLNVKNGPTTTFDAAGKLTVGGALQVQGGINIQGDSQFYLGNVYGQHAINFGAGVYIQYDAPSQKFFFANQSGNVASLDSNGNLRIKGSLSQGVTP